MLRAHGSLDNSYTPRPRKKGLIKPQKKFLVGSEFKWLSRLNLVPSPLGDFSEHWLSPAIRTPVLVDATEEQFHSIPIFHVPTIC